MVDVRPADGRSDATNEDDDDSAAPDDSNAIVGKAFDADENKYREKPRKVWFLEYDLNPQFGDILDMVVLEYDLNPQIGDVLDVVVRADPGLRPPLLPPRPRDGPATAGAALRQGRRRQPGRLRRGAGQAVPQAADQCGSQARR